MILTRPSVLLRIEEVGLFIAAVLLYVHFHFSWRLFVALFLTPDLCMFGYVANPRIGAAFYKLVHTLTGPVVLFAFAYAEGYPAGLAIAIIWAAHIAFDRMLGHGLKHPREFKDTHLQHIA